jgi:hypothetical protein
MGVFTRIQTARPSRFLTTFAAALLTSLTRGFATLVDSDRVATLHHLMLDFIRYCCDSFAGTRAGKREVEQFVQGLITTYIPIYLGDQMLYWSGRYWEASNAIPSTRTKSKDLVNEDLELELGKLNVGFSQIMLI